ncbi:MAG: ferritin family protein [Acidobacteriota bacterium]
MKQHQPLYRTALVRLSAALAFCMLLPSVAVLEGCRQQEEIEKKPLVTPENLQTAYAREARLAYTYDLFAKKAAKEYLPNVARLYRAAAASEAIHAAAHLEQMKALGVVPKPYTPEKVVVGTTMQTLRMAVSDEQIETESMYPNLIATAEAEKLNEIAATFRRFKRADEAQIRLMREAADNNGAISHIPFYICPKCGGLVLTSKTTGCADCGVKPGEMIKVL